MKKKQIGIGRKKSLNRIAISGIQEVWQAAKEGKAFKLLIEKDNGMLKDYQLVALITRYKKCQDNI